MTTILANLLDNSIEAASKVETNRFINFYVNQFNDFVVINIVNSMKDRPINKNNRFKTTKKNHEGLGIENVRKTLEQYEGTMVVDYTEDEFKVNIVIPI